MWSKQSTKATRLPPLSPSCHVCMLMFSFCIYPACSFFISWCVYVCVCFCLPGCWTNSREIILPQSPSLSGQSDEELVIFNTGEGGGGVVQVSERPNSLSVSAGAHLTSPSVSLPWVFFFTVGSFQKAQMRQRELLSSQQTLKNCGDKLARAENGQIQSHRGGYADIIRLEDRSVRVLAGGQVIKAVTDHVPNALSYLCLSSGSWVCSEGPLYFTFCIPL